MNNKTIDYFYLSANQPAITQRSSRVLYLLALALSIISLWISFSLLSHSRAEEFRIITTNPSTSETQPRSRMMSSSTKLDDGSQGDHHFHGFYYRVHGKVQGVYFRKYTQQKANEFGVSGWIRNDKTNGTVEGQVLCHRDEIQNCNQMKVWLQSEGSPMSQIDHAQFEAMEDQEELLALWRNLSERNNNNHSPAFEIRKTLKRRRK